jgi:hypothetical protein
MICKPIVLINALILMLFLSANRSCAQDWKTEKRVNVLFGLTQVIAHGFNIEGNYIHNRLIIDYSHGVALQYQTNNVPDYLKNQNVEVYVPWTTGFGIGYRWTSWLNTRIEPKWHRFEYYYAGDLETRNEQIASCNAFSLGIGVYGDLLPFKKKNNFLKGIMIAPSVRYWPTVSSNWNSGPSYYNKITMQQETFKTPNAGLGLTPWVVNVSIGYSFQFKKCNAKNKPQ